jgi:hypothetical protein
VCGVRTVARLEASSKANATLTQIFNSDAVPVGDAGGHDGTGRDSDDSGLSVADESPEIWIRHVIAARQIRLWLTPDLFRLRRVTWKSRNAAPPPSNQGCLLLVGPSFLGFLHSGDAQWARRHPPSMAGGGSRGIHAARPTPLHLRSACTQVAICVVWDIAHLEAKSKANAALGFRANPVGDAGGQDGTGRDSDEAVGQ